MSNTMLILGTIIASIVGLGIYIRLLSHRLPQLFNLFSLNQQLTIVQERLSQIEVLRETLQRWIKEQQQEQQEYRTRFDEHQLKSLTLLQDTLIKTLGDVREQITLTLQQQSQTINQRMDKLTNDTQDKLRDISGQVERRLSEGFEKTNATFTRVIERLTMIDEAQKKITELSSNVVSLQEVLNDKRSRGAFGEVQLSALIHNVLPEQHFSLQHTLSNGMRVDCLLMLPTPTGNLAIDAKFPLESYQLMTGQTLNDGELVKTRAQFRQDIRKHVRDIAEKYIIEGETADGAMMFIPAEAVFAEIHAHFPDLVEFAQQSRVWMVSPTTMMAVLNTARAVLKDAATRQQLHIIQEHLIALSKDFSRFHERMQNLAKHIDQAQEDVREVNTSSKKIVSRFQKIEKVQLQTPTLEDHSEIA